jgi:6-pyruvoyl-tetrahydropterin synthase
LLPFERALVINIVLIMYTVIVEDSFEATHAVRMPDDALEVPHSHNWRVRAEFGSDELDRHDMVVDFCAVQAALQDLLNSLRGKNLNELSVFAPRTPTAEVVAHLIFNKLRAAGFANLRRVLVTEAPGCHAAYGE